MFGLPSSQVECLSAKPPCETCNMDQNGWGPAGRNAHCKIHDITHLLHSDTTRMAVVIKVRCNELISDKDV